MTCLQVGRFLVGVAFVAACSTPGDVHPTPAETARSLPPGTLAMVGTRAIDTEVVNQVARAKSLSPKSAADGEIRDALFASGAIARGLDDAPAVRAAIRGRLARARLELIRREVEGDPTDDEVAEATARHFFDLDRPPSFRVIHAVIKVPESADPARRAHAKALADRIAARTESATDASSFRAAAESTPDRGDFEVLVESLSPVAADGRVVEPIPPSGEVETYTPSFARVAARLAEPGQKSGVVSTEFGFHVMMLIESLPSHVVAFDERRRLLRDEILNDRAKRAKKELVERLRKASSPVIPRSVDSLLQNFSLDDNEVK